MLEENEKERFSQLLSRAIAEAETQAKEKKIMTNRSKFVFNNKFTVGQRVRNVITGYTGTVIDVDPNSYHPLRGRAKHNPYRVKYDHWVAPGAPWEREDELEVLAEQTL